MGPFTAPLLVLLLWLWAGVGARRLGRTSEAALHRRRGAVVGVALVWCLFLAAFAGAGVLPGAVAAPLAALACLVHGLLEPTRAGLWHHRRLRPLGLLGLVALAALIALFAPLAETGPLAFAAAIFHHHLATGVRHQAAAAAEVDELRAKVLQLTATAKLAEALPAATAAESGGDKGQRAG